MSAFPAMHALPVPSSSSESTHASSSATASRAVVIALLGLSAFAAAAALWMSTPTPNAIDASGLAHIRRWTPDALAAWAGVVTHLGGLPVTVPLAFLLAGMLWRERLQQSAIVWIVAFFAGQAILYGLKLAFDRMRPTAPGLLQRDFSFPSGHAFTAVLLYGAVLLAGWHRLTSVTARSLLALGMGLLILTIGWSRLVLRVHYPTDVLGGYALGAAWLALTWMGWRMWDSSALSSSTRSRR